jgi:hypothetical protein
LNLLQRKKKTRVNPSLQSNLLINQDVADLDDLLGLNFLSFEAGLSFYESYELYIDGSVLGVHWARALKNQTENSLGFRFGGAW